MIKKSDKIHHAHCHGVAVADVMGHTNARKIRRAVGIGCIVNAVLMVLKMVTGHYGHSDALVADGFHSLNDFAADLIMLMFVSRTRQPLFVRIWEVRDVLDFSDVVVSYHCVADHRL